MALQICRERLHLNCIVLMWEADGSLSPTYTIHKKLISVLTDELILLYISLRHHFL